MFQTYLITLKVRCKALPEGDISNRFCLFLISSSFFINRLKFQKSLKTHLKYLIHSSRVENWRATESFQYVSSSRHVKPSVQISRTGLSCYLPLKVYATYRPGSAFKPGNTLFCNRYRALRYYRAKHYSTCSSQSHVVFLHAEDVFLSSFQPNLLHTRSI